MHWINIENKCVFANTVCPQLSVTNDSHLPQDMILLNCLFRIYLFFSYSTLVGPLIKDNWTIRYSAWQQYISVWPHVIVMLLPVWQKVNACLQEKCPEQNLCFGKPALNMSDKKNKKKNQNISLHCQKKMYIYTFSLQMLLYINPCHPRFTFQKVLFRYLRSSLALTSL